MAGLEGPDDKDALTAQSAADVGTVAKGGAVQIAGQISSRFLAMGFTAVAVHLLGTAGYGLYRKVLQLLAIGGQLGLAGFNYATMRFIARARAVGDPGVVRGAMRVGLTGSGIVSAIVFAVIVIAADPIADAFDGPSRNADELARLLRLGAAYVPLLALMQVLRYCTQAYKTMVPSVIVGNIIQPVARFVLGVAVLLWVSQTVAGAVVTVAVATGIGALAGAWYCRRMLTEQERTATPVAPVGPMVRFALPQAGASLLGIQSLGLGIIVLGLYRGDSQVGLFGIALALQAPGTVFLSGIVNIWAPVVTDLHGRGEIERLDSLYKTINRWIATFSFPVFAALMVDPDVFVRIFAGSRALEASSIVVLLAVGNLFYTGTGPTGYVISMTGRPGVNAMNSAVAAGLYVLLGAWIVPEHGAVGMAAVDAVVTALVNSVRVVQARILVGVQPFGRTFLKPVVATLVGAGVLLLWKLVPGGGSVLDITGLVVAGIVYLGVLRALGLDPEERHVWERIRARAFRAGRRG